MEYDNLLGYDVLEQIFDTLPSINDGARDFKPYFDYGTHEDLLKRLKDNRKSKVKYPLIWLQNPYRLDKSSTTPYWVESDITLVLATKTTQDASNKERIRLTVEKVLKPLHKNVLTALRQSGVTKVSDYSDEVYFNYAASEKESTDIWDAIKLDISISFKSGNCTVKNINY